MKTGGKKMPKKPVILLIFMFLMLNVYGLSVVFAATSITAVNQKPWIINDTGNLKSETDLVINNTSSAYNAWVKITVTGKTAYMESLGSLASGSNSKTVHVLELNNDGDNVTFEIFNNSAGTGTALCADTRSQKKIRHWKVYVAHDMHLDVGYTDYQETLKDTKWPGYLDSAAQYVIDTNSWGTDDKFRYPVEGSYTIYDGAWNVRSADWIETLKSNMAGGRITYPAAFFNVCYEGLGAEELARFTYFSQRHMKDMFGTASNKHAYESDNPGLSWGAVDALVDAGFKYYSFRFNPDHSIWDRTKYPYLYYMQGKNPLNKLLIYDGPHYGDDEMDFQNADSNVTFNNCTTKIMNYHTTSYPYDAIIENFTYNRQDNGAINANVKTNIKNLNAKTDASGRDYVYPQFINSTVNDFFGYVETNFAASVPSYKGTVENWWNFGAASTAFETGLNKVNHEKLPAAEIFATFANKAVSNVKYPYENLLTAYKNMLLYDEHTWGPSSSACDDQWVWKRNTALQSDTVSNKTLADSLAAINTLIPTTDKTIVVYNALSFSRSDLVTVKQSDLPSHFDITDIETSVAVKYQKLSDGTAVFVAGNVPGLGYKCFRVSSRADDPTFSTSITSTANTIENNYFKVTFDSSGAISSILDKQNSNREMVDGTAPYKMNQFIYKQSNSGTYYTISSATLTSSVGCIMGTMSADGATTGVDSMKRNVILYDSIPRIDIVNDTVKTAAPAPINSVFEEGFFAFPLNVSNFMLRHEMPSGDVRPHVTSTISDPTTEQFYTSCPNFYTVNRWIDASNQSDYGITLSPVNAPIVQYGQLWFHAMNYDYNTTTPWVYSEVFDNNWKTNFQITQPGKVTFKYSIKSHTGADWKAGRADRFGAEVCNELKPALISGIQSGTYNGVKGQFIGINQDNVVLTTAKIAEASGEGVILRFNETKGQDTTVTVDLSWMAPASVTETDLVENDLSALTITNNTISFTIKGYGWKTVRIKSGTAPAQVTGVAATMNSSGTQVAWDNLSDANLAHYEVFRGTTSGFAAGSGNYLASVSVNHYYDLQVKTGLTNTYFYKVRAVRAGLKGTPSAVAQAISGTITDTAAPSAPGNLKAVALYGSRVSLAWETSTDNLYVKGYKVYRNGAEIKDVDLVLNSFLDTSTVSGGSYDYSVKAYDSASNLSAASNTVTVMTAGGPTPVSGNIASQAGFSASSEYSSNYAASKVADNIIGVQDSGEWASLGEVNPWIQLNWSAAKTINKIVLFDRNNLTDDANGGTLSFSDTSTVGVTGIPKDGTAKTVTFANKTITWVKFQVSGGNGQNVGLSEMQVFETTGATATPTPTPTPGGTATPTPTPTPALTVVDDDNVSAVYTGTWSDNNTAPSRYNSTEHYTKTTNSYYQYTFTGTEIRLVATKEANRGKSDVYIDGVFDVTLDQYSATTYYQQEIYTKAGLASGSHTVKVVCKGQKNASATDYYVCIDAFKYR
jgi:hypothetical protein